MAPDGGHSDDPPHMVLRKLHVRSEVPQFPKGMFLEVPEGITEDLQSWHLLAIGRHKETVSAQTLPKRIANTTTSQDCDA